MSQRRDAPRAAFAAVSSAFARRPLAAARKRGRRSSGSSLVALALLLAAVAAAGAGAGATLHHDLVVRIAPDAGRVEVHARVTLPRPAPPGLAFTLSRSLPLPTGPSQWDVRGRLARYPIEPGTTLLEIRYAGALGSPEDPPDNGVISARGVYLDGGSGWYPDVAGAPSTFELRVALPAGWQAVSQGRRIAAGKDVSGWRAETPQRQIYLIAGPFERFVLADGGRPEVSAYLRSPDPALATPYLAAGRSAIRGYERLIGPYPYAKFALVENFWETGYGMPSFTLLGSRVIRLPFIVETSFPHEILHNWWGNGVYASPHGGNWTEGLTSYLADHAGQEQRGAGARYRRDTLQRYAAYAGAGRDLALRDFRGGRDARTQAVGYGKSLMLFHMLRLRIGDGAFVAGLRRLYREHRFADAGFPELAAAFESTSGQGLADFFAQWVDRAGAPVLHLGKTDVSRTDRGYRVAGELRQTQPGPIYELRVPLAVRLASGALVESTVAMAQRARFFALDLPEEPAELLVDPRFDLFRHLAPGETPASLGDVFGARRATFVIAGEPASAERAANTRLGRAWARPSDAITTADEPGGSLPAGPVWLIGGENRLAGALAGDPAVDEVLAGGPQLRIGSETYGPPEHSFAVAARVDGRVVGWVVAATPAAAARLAAKLPHYGKYGYAVFRGPAAENVLKGQWTSIGSPLARRLGAAAASGAPLPPRPALVPPGPDQPVASRIIGREGAAR